MSQLATLPEIVADQALDAAGFTSLREADGSEHGNTDTLIATVYDEAVATHIVQACNAHADLLRELQNVLRELEAGSGYDRQDEIRAVLKKHDLSMRR